MNLPDLAVGLALAAFCVALLALLRTRKPARAESIASPSLPASRPDPRPRLLGSRPTTATHQIAAFTLDGEPLPDHYLGDDDRDVKRKWHALKQRQNPGHWELWHRRHGWRDSITRHR